jgi:hypothetical protein
MKLILALSLLAALVSCAQAHFVTADSRPCNKQLNRTFVPNPVDSISVEQIQLANRFLALLSNSSHPPLNSSKGSLAGNFVQAISELVLVAQAYHNQTVVTLVALKQTSLFGVMINITYLATLPRVYQQYQAGDPQLRQRIKAGFGMHQKQWDTRAQSMVDTQLAATQQWQLPGPARGAFNYLLVFLNLCQSLPSTIAGLEKLIAQLSKDCGKSCQTTIDSLEKQLAQDRDDLDYCQLTQDYAQKLYVATQVMTGQLWGHVYGIMHAIVDDSRLAITALQQLDLDDIIFNLNLQAVVSQWSGMASEAYSLFYYACRNGLVPSVPH